MKQDEVIKRVMANELVLVAEWRGAEVDVISWSDKKTGATKSSEILKHSIEAGNKQLQLSEWPAEGTVKFPEGAATRYKKGQPVVCFIDSWMDKQGSIRAGGEIHPLEK